MSSDVQTEPCGFLSSEMKEEPSLCSRRSTKPEHGRNQYNIRTRHVLSTCSDGNNTILGLQDPGYNDCQLGTR